MKKKFDELRKCPNCDGEVKLMANPFAKQDEYVCFTRCMKCKKEYGLTEVKLRILKNLKVSAETINSATKAWNKGKKVELIK